MFRSAIDSTAHLPEIAVPRPGRHQGRQPGARLAVVGVLRVAPVHTRHMAPGQLGLDAQHRLRALGRARRRITQQLQHAGHMIDVLRAQGHRLCVVVQIVVAVGQAEAGLVDLRDGFGRVPGVLHGAQAEEHRAQHQVVAMAVADDGRNVGDRGDVRDGRKLRSERSDPAPVEIGLGHAGSVVVADLLLVGRAGFAAAAQAFEQGPKQRAVFVLHLSVSRPAGLIRRYRVVPDPSAARELVEIHARVGRAIHRRWIERGGIRQLGVRRRRGGRLALRGKGRRQKYLNEGDPNHGVHVGVSSPEHNP